MPNKDQNPSRLTRRDRRLQKRKNAVVETNTKLFTRRNFLIALGGGAVAIGGAVTIGRPVVDAVSSFLHQTRPEGDEQKSIRRIEGTWSTEDVEELAKLMQADADYTSFSHAGKMLLGNQKGEPTFSKESVIFTDDPVKFVTVPRIDVAQVKLGTAPAASVMHQSSSVNVVLNPLSGNKPMSFESPSRLTLTEIRLNAGLLNGASDFLIELMVAKEVSNIAAADLSARIVAKQVYANYQAPEDINMQSASLIYLLNGVYGTLKMKYVYDIWGQFLTVLDYLLAKDRGKFVNDNQKLLGVWEIASNIFRNKGLIIKGSDGKYTYPQKSNNLFNAWFQAASDMYPLVHS